MRKTSIAGALVALGLLGTACAQAQIAARPKVVLGLGVTGGGDRIATVEYNDGSDQDIRAGQLWQLHAGLQFELTPHLALQTTIGYHADGTGSTRDGRATFSRVPIEVLGQVRFGDGWRVGAGLRYVTQARYETRGVLSDQDLKFENARGFLVMGEYLVTPAMGIQARYVDERYRAKAPYTGKLDGSHFGLFFNFYL